MKINNKEIEKYRMRTGLMKSDSSYGNNGVFVIYNNGPDGETRLHIIASDTGGWEHVSVSLGYRIPTWNEMCFIKDLFWNEEECVIQFHPPKIKYVNMCKNCLHLWKKAGSEFELPPIEMVGV